MHITIKKNIYVKTFRKKKLIKNFIFVQITKIFILKHFKQLTYQNYIYIHH